MKRAAATLFGLMLFAPALGAHELGATRVNATFTKDDRYRIDVLVDPETLLYRLHRISTDGELLPPVPPNELAARVGAQSALIARQVEIRFDGAAAAPAVHYIPLPDAAGARGLLRFEGQIPRGARTFQWRYALPYTPYLLTVQDEAAPGPQRQWVEGDAPSAPLALGKRMGALSRGQIALLYLRLGFTHIIPKGLDHILFVLGIFLLTTRWRPLLAQITAFTVAHSVTLALTIYQVVSLPSQFVEPAIALSIAYVGIENAFTRAVKPWRIALVFAFGLLHGMGFAGVLQELGIPKSELATALVAFNAGVELGQLAVVGLAFLLVASWARRRSWYRARVIIPLSVLIAFTGLYWTIERSGW